LTIELIGNWQRGFAYDIHTLASAYLGVDEDGFDRFDNMRSDMGELLYQLKYRGDRSAVNEIVKLLDRFKGIETMDGIVPIPASKKRTFQPVLEIAKALGERRGVKVVDGLLLKREGFTELKNIKDPEKRRLLLEQAFYVSGACSLSEQNVLLIDDLFRSGATLSAATKVLYEEAGAANVSVLTMTKTRTKR
jgi:predicted amidophosphoribosyltransferase